MLEDELKCAVYNTNLAKFRKILLNSMNAHFEMRAKTEYDAAFHHGMEHVLFLLDTFMKEEYLKAIAKKKKEN